VAFLGFNDRLYRVNDLAAAEDLAGYQKDLWLYRALIQA
jgi:hypothetical protein